MVLISSGGSISFSLRFLWAIGAGVIIEIVLVIVGGDGGELGGEKLLAHVRVHNSVQNMIPLILLHAFSE